MRRRVIFLLLSLCRVTVAADGETSAFSVYGFLLPAWTASSGAVESFSQPNATAYTGASNPALAAAPDEARAAFHLGQSRIGFLARPVTGTTGRLELDFIDFAKATPTTASLPRVRRAVIDVAAGDELTLRFGQDWDLVSPFAPHTYNLVGHYFQSGDIGFMRIQAQASWKRGKWEHAVALGLPGSNNASSDGLLELGLLPTVALRETYRYSDTGSVGVSFLAARLRRQIATPAPLFAGAATIFAEAGVGGGVEVRGEAYVGQNTFNLGLLGLGFGGAKAAAVSEAGAYVTTRVTFGSSSVFGGAGGSWVLNPAEMSASYAPTTAGPNALAGTGPGIESNVTVRAGYDWKPTAKLVVFGEVAGLVTRHHLLAADAARFDAARRALLVQVGTMLSL